MSSEEKPLTFWVSGWDPKTYPLHGPFDDSGIALSRTLTVFVTAHNPEKHKAFEVIERSAYAMLESEVLRLQKEIEELMKVDYWQDRHNIVKAERDQAVRDAKAAMSLLRDIDEGKYTYYQSSFQEDGSYRPDYYEVINRFLTENNRAERYLK
jgi:hypothetical protein